MCVRKSKQDWLSKTSAEVAEIINVPVPTTLSSSTVHKPEEQNGIVRALTRFYHKYKHQVDTTITVFWFLFDVYKIFMGSFLTIFTYQSCDIINEKIACFMAPFQLFCLSFNCLLFVTCFVLLGFQVHRESYFSRELGIYKNANESIQHYFDKHPEVARTDIYDRDILAQIKWFNIRYCFCVKMNLILYCLNVLFSGIGIYTYSYMGTKTITTFVSDILLLGLLLGNSAYVVYTIENSDKVLACSAYKQDYVRFNWLNVWMRKQQYISDADVEPTN